MDQKKWSFPVLKAARWATPVLDAEGNPTEKMFEDWVLWVRVDSLPLDLPLDPNARHPDTTKPTPKAIARTLQGDPDEFVKRNSGICMVAQACHVKDSMASLILNVVTDDEEREEGRRGDGILNGGHSYAVIREVLKAVKPKGTADGDAPNPGGAVVRVEVQTGLAEEDLADISRARNRSEPVQEYSLKNLGNAWQDIKNVLPKEMRQRVRFMENDPEADKNAEYDVGDLVKLLALFNNKVYPVGKKDPLSAYSSEKRLVATWDANDFKHLLPHLLDLIKLHDEVTLLFPKEMGSKPGKVNGVIAYDKKAPWTLLSGKPSRYYVPPPFTFPVLAALRVFLADDGSKWHVPPETLLKDETYVKELISETWNEYKRSGRSSAAFFGRNRQVWKMLALMMLVKRQTA
ncbi:AIPR family protein [Corallococcus sp. BB11-1]|uniref:AIPR family protein n=1 Tax=Corallococcus sp. BB11-1 TaxID=2996783 RepID=UPI0022717584|nr:AIPR family protein [Corallococcus sp. BB11-1]MCY1030545.1 AIPR family protein [Corallococcus sp. BB11-1]